MTEPSDRDQNWISMPFTIYLRTENCIYSNTKRIKWSKMSKLTSFDNLDRFILVSLQSIWHFEWEKCLFPFTILTDSPVFFSLLQIMPHAPNCSHRNVHKHIWFIHTADGWSISHLGNLIYYYIATHIIFSILINCSTASVNYHLAFTIEASRDNIFPIFHLECNEQNKKNRMQNYAYELCILLIMYSSFDLDFHHKLETGAE